MTSVKQIVKSKKSVSLLLAATVAAAAVLTCGFGLSSVSAKAETASSAGVNTTGLGLAVNAVTTEYLDLTELKDGAPIFNTTWINSQIADANYIEVNATTVKSSTASEFSTIATSYKNSLKLDSSVTADVNIFSAGLSSGFDTEESLEYILKSSHFYYLFNSQIQRYTLSLPDYSTQLSTYTEHLSTDFTSALNKLFNGSMTYKTFFDTYGTHVIMKGIYGGSFNLFYHVASNTIDVGGTSSSALSSSIKAGVEGVAEGSTSASYSIENVFNCSSTDYVDNMSMTARGGNVFTGTSFNDFKSSYKVWAQSVASQPVLMGMSSDGFVPIWELLPSTYSGYKSTMKSEFKKYASSYYEDIEELNNHIILAENEGDMSLSSDIRTEEYEITDSGPMYQKYDIIEQIPFKKDEYVYTTGYGYDLVVAAGYNYVTVSVTLYRREVNDGYQEFYLYNNTNNVYDDGQICHEQRTYSSGKVNKNYKSLTVEFEKVSITNFKQASTNCNVYKPFVVRYGATGVGEDTWLNKNAVITITFSRT